MATLAMPDDLDRIAACLGFSGRAILAAVSDGIADRPEVRRGHDEDESLLIAGGAAFLALVLIVNRDVTPPIAPNVKHP